MMKCSFILCWFFVATVACYDLYLTIHLFEDLRLHEENPIARQILQLENWRTVSTFAALKMGGTIIALQVATLMYFKKRKLGVAIIAGLALFQLWLLGYLSV